MVVGPEFASFNVLSVVLRLASVMGKLMSPRQPRCPVCIAACLVVSGGCRSGSLVRGENVVFGHFHSPFVSMIEITALLHPVGTSPALRRPPWRLPRSFQCRE